MALVFTEIPPGDPFVRVGSRNVTVASDGSPAQQRSLLKISLAAEIPDAWKHVLNDVPRREDAISPEDFDRRRAALDAEKDRRREAGEQVGEDIIRYTVSPEGTAPHFTLTFYF